MKKCRRCKRLKVDTKFASNSRTLDGLHSWCKDCVKTYDKGRYNNRGPSYWTGKNRNRIERYRKKLWKYLQKHPCENCDETNPIVLDFAHKTRTSKIANVSLMVTTHSWKNVYKEIIKCKILCANCHRIETAEEAGWYKYIEEII